MPSSTQRDNRPDVPTRLAKKTNKTDRFETQVYQDSDNLFYTLDKITDPGGLDWVMVELHNGRKAIELYDGQNFIALVNILEFYQLSNGSEQRR